MERTDIRILLPTLKIVKPYLPKSIVSRIERVFGKPRPTREQISEIVKLGESVGLQRNEIFAAVDAPLTEQGVPDTGRTSMIFPMILISILAVVILLLTWAVVDPDSFPFHVYAPGTFYGTIRPQDFSSHELAAIVT